MKREGQEMVCAALVLVGNELISGNIADENRVFVARELQAVGVKTMSVHMVRDDVDATADLVRHLASRATYVITIGGLGPTVDDVTLEASGHRPRLRQPPTPQRRRRHNAQQRGPCSQGIWFGGCS